MGSTSLTTNKYGTKTSEIRYTAWGAIRYATTTSASLPAQYTYTGQFSDSYINLLWYGSRHYDPELGRFIQPDSIVPLASQGVQAWDRYAYANNAPTRYTDPTGHMIDDGYAGNHRRLDCQKYGQYCNNGKPKSSAELLAMREPEEQPLDYNGWDFVPYLTSLRRIIRGYQEASNAYNDPAFDSQQATIQTWYNNCYGQCHYASSVEYDPAMPSGGPQPDVPVVDQYSAGMGDVAGGTVDLGLQTATTIAAAQTAPVQVFAHGGPEWHLGLETVENMNIIHIGNHSRYGVHMAFGAVRP